MKFQIEFSMQIFFAWKKGNKGNKDLDQRPDSNFFLRSGISVNFHRDFEEKWIFITDIRL